MTQELVVENSSDSLAVKTPSNSTVHQNFIGDPLAGEHLLARAEHIKMLLTEVLRPGVHFDKTPGTNGLSLLKAGAEKLLSSFQIALSIKVDSLGLNEKEVGYRVYATGVSVVTGVVLGEGIGECSSLEEKYKWRVATCKEEFDYFPVGFKRLHFKAQWENGRPTGGASTIMQVRQNPNDKSNTILKMAKKRAMVDLCQTTLAASDLFEDMPVSSASSQPVKKQYQASKPRQSGSSVSSVSQDKFVGIPEVKQIKAALLTYGLLTEELLEPMGVNNIGEIEKAKLPHVLSYIEQNGKTVGDSDA